jgi:hypothetical protein
VRKTPPLVSFLGGWLRGLLIALMMEAARTSETLVNFYQTTRRCNREDSHLIKSFIEAVNKLSEDVTQLKSDMALKNQVQYLQGLVKDHSK